MENLLPDMKGRVNAASIPAGTVTEVFPNDILVGNIRPYLKKIWFANRLGGASPDVLVLRVTQEKSVYSKYLYRVLCSEVFFSFYSSTARGGKMPRGDKKRILDFRFPLPSVAAQKEIVDILDQMDALVNDLTSGLPAEMEARRKQYAYYRDRLLTFKEKPQM